jgi:hypothetical protein
MPGVGPGLGIEIAGTVSRREAVTIKPLQGFNTFLQSITILKTGRKPVG